MVFKKKPIRQPQQRQAPQPRRRPVGDFWGDSELAEQTINGQGIYNLAFDLV